MKRKLTETERVEKQDLLLEHLNLLADEEIRKADFNAATNKQIKYHTNMIDTLRQEINSGEVEVDPQGKLL